MYSMILSHASFAAKDFFYIDREGRPLMGGAMLISRDKIDLGKNNNNTNHMYTLYISFS